MEDTLIVLVRPSGALTVIFAPLLAVAGLLTHAEVNFAFATPKPVPLKQASGSGLLKVMSNGLGLTELQMALFDVGTTQSAEIELLFLMV